MKIKASFRHKIQEWINRHLPFMIIRPMEFDDAVLGKCRFYKFGSYNVIHIENRQLFFNLSGSLDGTGCILGKTTKTTTKKRNHLKVVK
jgi:hypothetical protein